MRKKNSTTSTKKVDNFNSYYIVNEIRRDGFIFIHCAFCKRNANHVAAAFKIYVVGKRK